MKKHVQMKRVKLSAQSKSLSYIAQSAIGDVLVCIHEVIQADFGGCFVKAD